MKYERERERGFIKRMGSGKMKDKEWRDMALMMLLFKVYINH